MHRTDTVCLGSELGMENIEQIVEGFDGVRLLIKPEAFLVVGRLEELSSQMKHVDRLVGAKSLYRLEETRQHINNIIGLVVSARVAHCQQSLLNFAESFDSPKSLHYYV